ncbi:hypothetical protein BX666DRAFT_1986679 [Dichotomocladium elegans]|nr:hypothetical protein BX666DRAFT_1986679 [Dichotomocladium elegans]
MSAWLMPLTRTLVLIPATIFTFLIVYYCLLHFFHPTMTGSTFRLTLREGITGGLVGPTDSYSGATVMNMELKPQSKLDYVTQTATVSTDKASSFIQLVMSQLKTLPMEEPFGSEDIYGFDTGIMFSTNDFAWATGKVPHGN